MTTARSPRARLARVTAAVLAGVLTLGGCSVLGSGGGAPEETEIRLGLVSLPDSAGAQLAHDNGYFQEEGLDVTVKVYPDSPAALAALHADEVDVAVGRWGDVFGSGDQSRNVFILGEAYQATAESLTLVGQADTTIDSVPELKGRTVAVESTSGTGVLVLSTLLGEYDLTTDDVKLKVVAPDAAAEALKKGEADAAVLGEPFSTAAQLAGLPRIADLTGGGRTSLPLSGFLTLRDWAQDRPNTVAALRSALTRGQERARHRTEVERVLPQVIPALQSQHQQLPLLALGAYPTELYEDRLVQVLERTKMVSQEAKRVNLEQMLVLE